MTQEHEEPDARSRSGKGLRAGAAFLAVADEKGMRAAQEKLRALGDVVADPEVQRQLLEAERKHREPMQRQFLSARRVLEEAKARAFMVPEVPELDLTIRDELLRNDDPVFQKEGQTWRVVFNGIQRSVGDSKGMTYIWHLLRRDEEGIDAMALRDAVRGEGSSTATGSAGEILDRQALREYREALVDIDKDLAEAEKDNDLARKERLTEEGDALRKEIARATALGGNRRKVSDNLERARNSVSKAIHRAFRAIKKHHKPLWKHLVNCLVIGAVVAYRPDQTITWTT